MRKTYRKNRFKEALIVSPFKEADNRNFNEYDDEDVGPTFNGDILKTSSSEYENISHYEIDTTNTGYGNEGILYIDPETDGTEIIITKVDEDGLETNYILDLSRDVPNLSRLRESRNRNRRRIF